ncbi:hypothetical protein SAMN05216337_1001224 [Bradyrhizobium brasilense]|uniref:Uncharacterized protein n=1 Tax=Bradyrhizobium brasilense TaxID=1419277 RepID=A0A1G6IQS8_9BRAD|nr:hypothetical protein [Bradyrhizobium brasilense]SDC08834.1 hypothetical protein SAMN05216337_1001224 [Bradyrhizobium brasilense]
MPSALLAGQLEAIRIIDRKIDGIRLELFRRTRVRIFDAGSWQLAWDRHPDLSERHDGLFRLRGVAQQTRDLIIEREYQAARRRERTMRRKAAVTEVLP